MLVDRRHARRGEATLAHLRGERRGSPHFVDDDADPGGAAHANDLTGPGEQPRQVIRRRSDRLDAEQRKLARHRHAGTCAKSACNTVESILLGSTPAALYAVVSCNMAARTPA